MKRSRFSSTEARLKGVRRICVLRSNGLGDYIFSLPALEALAAAYPRAEIVLLAKPWHAAFLRGRPGPVHRVITLPFIKGVCETPHGSEDAAAIRGFVAAMRRERLDICCQLYGGGRFSNPFVMRLGARLTVGMKDSDARASRLDRWIPYIYYFPEVARYLEVVRLCGAPAVTYTPRLQITAADVGEARNA
jgi:ADP-heptose:LPS heptosyltransferase